MKHNNHLPKDIQIASRDVEVGKTYIMIGVNESVAEYIVVTKITDFEVPMFGGVTDTISYVDLTNDRLYTCDINIFIDHFKDAYVTTLDSIKSTLDGEYLFQMALTSNDVNLVRLWVEDHNLIHTYCDDLSGRGKAS